MLPAQRPGTRQNPPAGPPGIARIPPIWPNLPAGHPRVASGTLLPVIGLIVLLTATLAAPAASTLPAPAPAPPAAVQLAASELVDRSVRAGAQYVFVGPRTGLRGPGKVVLTLANHDDHLHVRIRPGPRTHR